MLPATLQVTQQITDMFGAPIKQYPGQRRVTRGVRVKVPGTHFIGLTKAEQQVDYWVCAMEFRERHVFQSHADKRTPVPGSASSAKTTPSKIQTTKASGRRFRFGTSGVMPWPPRLPPPLMRLTSTHALILPWCMVMLSC